MVVKNALAAWDRVQEIQKKIDDADLNNAMADLKNEIANQKLRNASLVEENAKLKEELNDLKASGLPAMEPNERCEGGYKFEGSDEVCCPKCYEAERKKHSSYPVGNGQGRICNVCKTRWPTGIKLLRQTSTKSGSWAV